MLVLPDDVFPAYRRHGYATEAVGAVMEWAQTARGAGRFIVSVSPDNKPSRALIARLGFTEIGQHLDDVDGIEHVYLRDVSAPAAVE